MHKGFYSVVLCWNNKKKHLIVWSVWNWHMSPRATLPHLVRCKMQIREEMRKKTETEICCMEYNGCPLFCAYGTKSYCSPLRWSTHCVLSVCPSKILQSCSSSTIIWFRASPSGSLVQAENCVESNRRSGMLFLPFFAHLNLILLEFKALLRKQLFSQHVSFLFPSPMRPWVLWQALYKCSNIIITVIYL